MIISKIMNFLKWLASKGCSAKSLAVSFSVGVYIAFSPFPGFHTGMVFLFVWLFSLNLAVVFAASCAICNPWTTIPIYVLDYIVGDFILKKLFGTVIVNYNPTWLARVYETITHYTSLPNISLWSFLFGGNVLGICAALLLYPIMKRVFERLIKESKRTIGPLTDSGLHESRSTE